MSQTTYDEDWYDDLIDEIVSDTVSMIDDGVNPSRALHLAIVDSSADLTDQVVAQKVNQFGPAKIDDEYENLRSRAREEFDDVDTVTLSAMHRVSVDCRQRAQSRLGASA